MILVPVAERDEREFLRAAALSRRLHRAWVSPPATRAKFRAFAASRQGPASFGWLVRVAATEQLVGFVEITNIVRGLFRSGYLGYYVFAGHERQGLMTEALRLAARKAFEDLHLHRLEANVQPNNTPSIALLKACGFVKEGYSEAYLKIGGRWRDHERWAIVARRPGQRSPKPGPAA